MENKTITTYQPTPSEASSGDGQSRSPVLGIIIVIIVFLALLIAGIVLLATAPLTTVTKVRDIFIIFMALESLLMGFVLVLLVVQIARLTNLLENEIKPILESTNETISTLRGTTAFLSDNLTQPVIKANEYAAGLRELLAVLGLMRRRSKKS